jgi:hypothetical protein
MKYADEMGSGAMIYIPSFIKIGSVIQKLMGWGGLHRQHGNIISLHLFFQNKASRLKKRRNSPCFSGILPTMSLGVNSALFHSQVTAIGGVSLARYPTWSIGVAGSFPHTCQPVERGSLCAFYETVERLNCLQLGHHLVQQAI